MKIKLIADSLTFREYLKEFPEEKSDYEISGLYNNGVQLLYNYVELFSEIIRMDINVTIRDSINTAKHFFWKRRRLKIIAIKSHHTVTRLTKLISPNFKNAIRWYVEIYRQILQR